MIKHAPNFLRPLGVKASNILLSHSSTGKNYKHGTNQPEKKTYPVKPVTFNYLNNSTANTMNTHKNSNFQKLGKSFYIDISPDEAEMKNSKDAVSEQTGKAVSEHTFPDFLFKNIYSKTQLSNENDEDKDKKIEEVHTSPSIDMSTITPIISTNSNSNPSCDENILVDIENPGDSSQSANNSVNLSNEQIMPFLVDENVVQSTVENVTENSVQTAKAAEEAEEAEAAGAAEEAEAVGDSVMIKTAEKVINSGSADGFKPVEPIKLQADKLRNDLVNIESISDNLQTKILAGMHNYVNIENRGDTSRRNYFTSQFADDTQQLNGIVDPAIENVTTKNSVKKVETIEVAKTDKVVGVVGDSDPISGKDFKPVESIKLPSVKLISKPVSVVDPKTNESISDKLQRVNLVDDLPSNELTSDPVTLQAEILEEKPVIVNYASKNDNHVIVKTNAFDETSSTTENLAEQVLSSNNNNNNSSLFIENGLKPIIERFTTNNDIIESTEEDDDRSITSTVDDKKTDVSIINITTKKSFSNMPDKQDGDDITIPSSTRNLNESKNNIIEASGNQPNNTSVDSRIYSEPETKRTNSFWTIFFLSTLMIFFITGFLFVLKNDFRKYLNVKDQIDISLDV